MKHFVLSASGQVTQADLENILSLTAQIDRLTGLRDGIAASVLGRLVAGAEVEQGARSFDVCESYTRATRRQKLVVR